MDYYKKVKQLYNIFTKQYGFYTLELEDMKDNVREAVSNTAWVFQDTLSDNDFKDIEKLVSDFEIKYKKPNN